MRLAFHGATTMTSDLETDVAVTAHAGFTALEVWAAKMDRYRAAHSPADLKTLFASHGVIPLDDICARLKRIGYDGPCSIELFRPEYWNWDPHELAIKARAAALKVLSPHFHIE